MSTKHVSRAVCAIQTSKHTNPIMVRDTKGYGPNNYRREFTHTSRVTVSVEESMVELTIDLASLIDRMGRRALSSRSGVSKLQGGMITAKCVGARSVRVVEEREIPIPSYAEAVNPVEV